ncbi:MAG TPA: response regulator [Burkholderiales bacterium]|nr:response regulator [Burkholderiales bacterium]
MKVLIVDDSELIRSRLDALLRQVPGVQIEHATNCLSAMIMVEATMPDAVILDLQLSDGWGTEVLKYIRSSGIVTKVIVLTNHFDAQQRVLCLAHGANYVFDKSTEFVAAVEAVRAIPGL